MRCYGCMKEYDDSFDICPFCGYSNSFKAEEALQIVPGTVLAERYLIGRSVGCGGFGVTYIAWDNQLEMRVAVKEYLPSEFATRVPGQTLVTAFSGDKTQQFSDGLDRFIDEARRLAKFRNEKGIVKVFDSFEENNTAYIVMEYLEGETLAAFLEREKRVSVDKAIEMMMPVMESLSVVHEAGIIHRDISPDNIFITSSGELKLIDFGAARYATTSHSRSLSVIVKPGYSPEEQYRSRGDQGPYTDVYALAGVIYKMVTGVTPPDAMERRACFEGKNKDILEPVSKYTKEITANQETAIHNAMNVRIEDRTPDVISFVGELISDEPVKRRVGKIKRIDILKWPLWLKITVPTGIITVVTLLVLLLTGVIHFSSPETEIDHNGMVRVPSVLNYSFDDAVKLLKKKGDLLNIAIGGGEYSNDIAENKIYLQSPNAASLVIPGTKILATISYGPETEYVIDVLGYTKDLAQKELESLGYVIEFEEKASDDAPGSVIGQSVKPNEKLAKGEKIVLTISTGNDEIDTSVEAVVPNVVGKDKEQAKKLVATAKLYLSIEDSVYSDKPAGQILEQDPAAGYSAHQGDIVYVVISLGKKTIRMPNVVGKNIEDARSAIESVGLSCGKVTYEENDKYNENCVISASAPAGEELVEGASVDFVVSKAATVSLRDIVGSSEKRASRLLNDDGLSVKIIRESSETVDKGYVISQSPKSGTKLKKGDVVTICISTGSESEDIETEKASLASIEMSNEPKKKTYYVGEDFDKTGMTVTALYTDESTKTITNYSISPKSFDSVGNKTVTLTYSEGGDKQTAVIGPFEVKKPTIEINPSSVSVVEGSTVNVTATLTPAEAKISDWKIGDTAIASASNGAVTGRAEGRTDLTVYYTYKAKTYSEKISVTITKKIIEVDSVRITPERITMKVGEARQLNAVISPRNATDNKVHWEASNGHIEIDSAGVVKAVSFGSTSVFALVGGKMSEPCVINVERPRYTLKINKGSGISSVSGGGSYTAGQKVNISATVSSGYDFSKWSSSGGGSFSSTTSVSTTFTMPEGNVTITANAVQKKYTLTINKGSGISSVSGSGSYTAGQKVNISATVSSGYDFSKWSSSGGGSFSSTTSVSTTFTMPEGNVTITANAVQKKYTLTINKGSGISSVSGSGSYTAGQKVNISATVSSGYDFSKWSSSGGGTFGNTASASTTFTMPSGNVTITANTTQKKYTLTINKGSGISSVSSGGSYTAGQKVTIRATPSSGYDFSRWSSSGGGSFSSTTSASTTFTMPAGNVTITASASRVNATSLSISQSSKSLTVYDTSVTIDECPDEVTVGDSLAVSVSHSWCNPSFTIEATVGPSNAYDLDVNVSSSDSSVAYVVSKSRNGNTTKIVIRAGDIDYNVTKTATITVSLSEDSSVKQTCKVTVNRPHSLEFSSSNESVIKTYSGWTSPSAVGTNGNYSASAVLTVRTYQGNTASKTVKVKSPGYFDFPKISNGYKVYNSSWNEVGGVWGGRYYVQGCYYRYYNGKYRTYAWVDASSGASWGTTTGWVLMYTWS